MRISSSSMPPPPLSLLPPLLPPPLSLLPPLLLRTDTEEWRCAAWCAVVVDVGGPSAEGGPAQPRAAQTRF